MEVKTLNNINRAGLNFLLEKGCSIDKSLNPKIMLLRSHKLLLSEIATSVIVIARAGAGTNNIPVSDLTNLGIPVINTPGANASAVRDLVFGSIITYNRNLIQAAQIINTSNLADIEQLKKAYTGYELNGKTMLIIGLGAIGRLVAKTAISFGINVFGFDPVITKDDKNYLIKVGVNILESLADACKQADIITIHVPFNNETKNLFNQDLIRICKDSSLILNFSRTGIVDDKAITNAIKLQKIRGYITDFPNTHTIINNQQNIMNLPHIGAATNESEAQCALIAARKSWEYIAYGSISSSVNFPTIKLGEPTSPRLCIIHSNTPKMLGQITNLIAKKNININNLHNDSRAELAYTVIDLSQTISENIFQEIKGVIKVRMMPCKS